MASVQFDLVGRVAQLAADISGRSPVHILVAEADQKWQGLLKVALEEAFEPHGRITVTRSSERAAGLASSGRYAAVVMSGEFYKLGLADNPQPSTMICVVSSNPATVAEARTAGFNAYSKTAVNAPKDIAYGLRANLGTLLI